MADVTVATNSTTTTAKVKSYLAINSIDTTHDAFISDVLLPAVKVLADERLNRTFTNVIPQTIELWILQVCFRFFEARPNGVLTESDAAGNIQWGNLDYTLLDGKRSNPGL